MNPIWIEVFEYRQIEIYEDRACPVGQYRVVNEEHLAKAGNKQTSEIQLKLDAIPEKQPPKAMLTMDFGDIETLNWVRSLPGAF